MEYVRVTSIEDPNFAAMHRMMTKIFPPEEVLAFELWKERIADPSIHVYVAMEGGEVVGDAVLAARDDVGVRRDEGNAGGDAPEQRVHREPVRQAAHHRRLGDRAQGQHPRVRRDQHGGREGACGESQQQAGRALGVREFLPFVLHDALPVR